MNRTLQQISSELLRCAEALSDAVGQKDLATVEGLLEERGRLLAEMRSIEVPADAESRRAIESVREHDRLAGEGLRAMRSEIVDELGRIRQARRTSNESQGRPRPSSFVSTRC